MSDGVDGYTPGLDSEVRHAYAHFVDTFYKTGIENGKAEFDRYLRDVRANALRDSVGAVRVSDWWVSDTANDFGNVSDAVREWLTSRAQFVEQGGEN
jgi:hypothetical protein